MKRFLAVVITVLMLLSILPVSSVAEELNSPEPSVIDVVPGEDTGSKEETVKKEEPEEESSKITEQTTKTPEEKDEPAKQEESVAPSSEVAEPSAVSSETASQVSGPESSVKGPEKEEEQISPEKEEETESSAVSETEPQDPQSEVTEPSETGEDLLGAPLLAAAPVIPKFTVNAYYIRINGEWAPVPSSKQFSVHFTVTNTDTAQDYTFDRKVTKMTEVFEGQQKIAPGNYEITMGLGTSGDTSEWKLYGESKVNVILDENGNFHNENGDDFAAEFEFDGEHEMEIIWHVKALSDGHELTASEIGKGVEIEYYDKWASELYSQSFHSYEEYMAYYKSILKPFKITEQGQKMTVKFDLDDAGRTDDMFFIQGSANDLYSSSIGNKTTGLPAEDQDKAYMLYCIYNMRNETLELSNMPNEDTYQYVKDGQIHAVVIVNDKYEYRNCTIPVRVEAPEEMLPLKVALSMERVSGGIPVSGQLVPVRPRFPEENETSVSADKAGVYDAAFDEKILANGSVYRVSWMVVNEDGSPDMNWDLSGVEYIQMAPDGKLYRFATAGQYFDASVMFKEEFDEILIKYIESPDLELPIRTYIPEENVTELSKKIFPVWMTVDVAPAGGSADEPIRKVIKIEDLDDANQVLKFEEKLSSGMEYTVTYAFYDSEADMEAGIKSEKWQSGYRRMTLSKSNIFTENSYNTVYNEYYGQYNVPVTNMKQASLSFGQLNATIQLEAFMYPEGFFPKYVKVTASNLYDSGAPKPETTMKIDGVKEPEPIYFDYMVADGSNYMFASTVYNDSSMAEEATDWRNPEASTQRYVEYSRSQYSTYYEYRYDGGMTKNGTVYGRKYSSGYYSTKSPCTDEGVFIIQPQWKGLSSVKLNVHTSVAEGYEDEAFQYFDDTIYYGNIKREQRTYFTITRYGMDINGRETHFTYTTDTTFRSAGDRTMNLSSSSFSWVPGTYYINFHTKARFKRANNYTYTYDEYQLFAWSHSSGDKIKVTLTEDGEFVDENGEPFVLENRYMGGSQPKPVVDTQPLEGITGIDTYFHVILKGVPGTLTENREATGSVRLSDVHVGLYRFYRDPANNWYPSNYLLNYQYNYYYTLPEGDYLLTYWTSDPNGSVEGYEYANKAWSHEKDVRVHVDSGGYFWKDGAPYAIPNHMLSEEELDTFKVKVNTTVMEGVKKAFKDGDQLLVTLSYGDGTILAYATEAITETGETTVTLNKTGNEHIFPGFGDSSKSNRDYRISFATIHDPESSTSMKDMFSNLWNSAGDWDDPVFGAVSCRNGSLKVYIDEEGNIKDATSLDQDYSSVSYEFMNSMKDLVLDNCSLLVPFQGTEEPDEITQDGEIVFKPVNSYSQIKEKNHYMIVVKNNYDNKWYALSYADGKGDQVLLKDVSSLEDLEKGYLRAETDLTSKGYIFTANKVSGSQSGVSLQFRSGVKDSNGKYISLKLGTSAKEYLPLLANSAGTVMALSTGSPASENTWNFQITKNNYAFVAYTSEFLGYKGFTVYSNKVNNLPVVTTMDDEEEGRFYLTNPGQLGLGSQLIYIARKPSTNMYDYVYEVDEKYATEEYYKDIQAKFNGDASSGELVIPMNTTVYILTDAPQDEPEQPDNNQYKLVKTYGDFVKTFCEVPDMSTQMVLVYTDEDGKEWALNPKGLVQVQTQVGAADYNTLSAGADNEWIANNNSRMGGYVSGSYKEFTYFGYMPAEMSTGGHMNFVSAYALRKSRLNTYAKGEYLILNGDRLMGSDDNHGGDNGNPAQLYMMQPVVNIRNEVDWEKKTSYRLFSVRSGVKTWLGIKDGQLVTVDNEDDAVVFDIYSPTVNRYFASANSDDYEPYYKITSLDDINADDQIVIVYDDPVTGRKEILAAAGRDFSPSNYYTLSAWLSVDDSPVDVTTTNDFPRDFRYTHRLDTRNPVKHVWAYTASEDGTLIMALGGASNVIGTEKSSSKTQKKYDAVVGLGSGSTGKLTIKTGAPLYYNQKAEVNFFCEDGKFYLRGGKSDAWLGATTYTNGRYYTSSGQYFEDYETLGAFTTVEKSDRIAVEIYKKGSLETITVNYYDVNDLDGEPKYSDTRSEGLLALRQDEDVKKDNENYIFVGWTRDKSKAGYLSFNDSCNLYDFNDVSRIASVKEEVRNKYGLLGNCNPEATNNIKILKDELEDGVLDLYPVYAVRGRTEVVTFDENGKKIIGLSDIKDVEGGGDGSIDPRERWLGSIDVEMYRDGGQITPSNGVNPSIRTSFYAPLSRLALANSAPVLKGTPVRTTLYFAYHNDDAADLNIKFIGDKVKDSELRSYLADPDFTVTYPSDQYIIDAVFAEQGGSEDGLKFMYNWLDPDVGGQLDNVKGGSTVKVYLTTNYQIKYYFDKGDGNGYQEITEEGWKDEGFYTTPGTENAIAADDSKADYRVEDKDGNEYRNLIIRDASNTGRFIDENIRRGDYSNFLYMFNDYPHVIDIASLPVPPEGKELAASVWTVKDKDLKNISTIDSDSKFALTETTYGTGNTVWSYLGERYADETNTYHLYIKVKDAEETGNLKVSKAVEGLDNCEDEFSFTVTLSDTTITGTYGDMEFKDGVAAFTLKDGEEKIAEGLPSEITYKVEEEEDDRFSIETDNDEGEVIADTTVEAVF
ncbi:MAG: hypothetical protein IKI62_01240, partial [Clostridia bacterium]|nr:hypothetical protein [Clostridia bacterium]